MAMAKIKNWGLLALAASFPLAMGQMDHGTHSMPAEASETSKPSPSGTPETHVVLVGYQGNSFLPNNTKANIGDTIEFQFLPKNHSVVRAGNMWPCTPNEKVGNGKQGFFSGFFSVGVNDVAFPKWRYTISESTPIYFYSSAGDDCNRYGMVGAINATPKDYQHQVDMALDATRVEQPDAAFDTPNPHMSHSTSTTSTASETPSPSNTAGSVVTEPSSSGGLGAGGIAGVVIGAVAGIALIAGLFYWYGVMRARQKPPTPDTSPMAQSSYLSPGGGAPSSFDARSATMFSSNGVPSPPPQSHLGLSPEQGAGPFVDGDTIYVPVKRSTIAGGDLSHLPAELYNPAELYHPGVPAHNSDSASWNRGFEQPGSDANSLRHHQTPPPVAQPAVNSRPSELSG